jgi:hypothetical protein
MIYSCNAKHSKRTYPPDFIYPETHPYPVPKSSGQTYFGTRGPRLPEERFLTETMVSEAVMGHPQKPEHFPKWLRFKTVEKTVQDFYKDQAGWLIVSERIKTRIEELEPGVHQFFPVRLLQKDGSEPWGQFYYLNIRRIVFSIDVEESPHFHWVTTVSERFPKRRSHKLTLTPQTPLRATFPLLVYRSEIVGKCHIWRERLDKDTPPNDGRFYWVPPGEPNPHALIEEGDIYALDTAVDQAHRFRISSAFKSWLDDVGAKGLDDLYPGCLDTELAGTVQP